MNGKLRRDAIIEIMQIQGYTTVQYLTETLHYSTATINRDLNILQNQHVIKRSYGGAELIKNQGVPLIFRYNKAKTEKRHIGKTAASFVEDGDTIFIDASTTTQCMVQYLTERKNLTVITNNMAVATYLSEYKINAICLGGTVIETPYMLGGDQTVENIMKYRADKMFFATRGVTPDYKISGSIYYLVHKNMMQNSSKIYYLVDHEKVNVECNTILCSFEKVDCVISDYQFPEELRREYQGTEFVYVDRKLQLQNI